MFLPYANFTTLATVAVRGVSPATAPSTSLSVATTSATSTAPYYPVPNATLARRHNESHPTGTSSPAGTSTSGNLTISVNGECSGSQTCLGSQYGDSCSEGGYCGPLNNTTYSGPGCQSRLGLCSSGNSTMGTNSSVSALPSIVGTVMVSSSVSKSTAAPSSTNSTTATSSSTSSTTLSSTIAPSISAPSYTYEPSSTTSVATSSASPASPQFTEPSDKYTRFVGTGEPSDGWPEQSQWIDFEFLFEMNRPIMTGSCAQWNVPNDTLAEIDFIETAADNVAKSSGIDRRFILAIMLQESNGCVRAPVTALSVANTGLLQSYMGSAKCNSGSATAPADVQAPCPSTAIHDMIEQGTMGTVPGGMSLTYALKQSGVTDVSKYYKAARIYNSGSIAASGLLQDGVATHCYASDIANRLLGWSWVRASAH